MVVIAFYLGAVVLCAIGALLLRGTSAMGRLGGRDFERRKKRKLIGQTLMAAAILPLVTGVITQTFSGFNPVVIPDANIAVPDIGVPSITAPNIAVPGSDQGTNDSPDNGVSLTAQHADLTTGDTTGIEASDGPSMTNPGPVTAAAKAESVKHYQQAVKLLGQAQNTLALAEANAALQADPNSEAGYVVRGSIYAMGKLWQNAMKDYQMALQINPTSARVRVSLAAIQFMEKKYDTARANFAVEREDPENGDFAKYMVFICDLTLGHVEAAEKELGEFNQVGSNASYYFSNAAWSLYHDKNDEATDWLASASRIYSPSKYKSYADALKSFAKPDPSTPSSIPPTLATPAAQ